MAAILNFLIFAKNGKTWICFYLLYPAEIERFCRNFRPIGYPSNVLLAISKNFPLPKNGGHFEFSPKMAKHKIVSISLTVRDRAISSKFSTHTVSEQCTLCNFQKFSSSHIWRPFWIFEFFPKMAKHKIDSISLTVRDRVISSKFSTHRVSKKCSLGNFQKFSSSHIWRPFWIFEFLPKIEKQKFASIFLTVQDRVTSSKFSTQPMQKGMKLK